MFRSEFWIRRLTLGLVAASAASGLGVGFAPGFLANPVLANPILASPMAQNAPEQGVWLLSQATPDGTLQLNDASDAIAQLQTRLTQLGYYDGPISGTFGPLTQEAVIKFQEAQGLAADGIVGPATASALARTSEPVQSSPSASSNLLQVGDTGPGVVALQQRLTAAGYYQGTVDGTFGPQTEAAVLAFQQAQGLTLDGIAGPATLAALTPATPPAGAAPQPVLPAPVEQPGVVTTAPPVVGLPIEQPGVTVPPIAPIPPAVATAPPVAPAPVLPPPSAGVLELQKQLADRGLYQGPLDGVMDLDTQQAIEQAQRNYGLRSGDWLP